MLVQPQLLDHPKFLILKQQLGPSACEVVLRLWGYAQTVKSSDLGRVDAAYIKTITRYGGSKDKLWQALAIPQLGGKAGWLDVHDDGKVTIHGFDEYNKNLNACRNNGKAGGRPVAKPTANPPDNPPDNPPALNELNRMNRTELNERQRSVLGAFFGREKGDAWSYLEESTLLVLLRRPDFDRELAAIQSYRSNLPSDRVKFFPQSVATLLSRWTEVLDRARSEGMQQKNAPATGHSEKRDRGEVLQLLALAREQKNAPEIEALQFELKTTP